MDTVGKMVALIGQSAPGFWLGIMLIFLFAVRLEMVPPSGRQEWNSIFLPAITLGWFFVAANMRLVRSAMLDVLDSEYIKLARAKGVSTSSLIWKHALRNAMIPPLTFAGVTLGNLVAGSITTELVFAWPGWDCWRYSPPWCPTTRFCREWSSCSPCCTWRPPSWWISRTLTSTPRIRYA